MKKYLLLATLILCLLTTACEDDNNSISDDGKYVPGEVLIGIKHGVSIQSVFDLMNEKGVYIESMTGFYNYSNLPNDSLSFIDNYLDDKLYLDRDGIGRNPALISASKNKIALIEHFSNMDLAAQQDWLETIVILKLEDMNEENIKSVTIKVEPGTEQDWVQQFKDHSYVQSAERNQYPDIIFP